MNKIITASCILFLLLVSCKRNHLNVDVSNINVEIKVDPFYKTLFSADTANMEKLANHFYNQYGHYWEVYNYGVIKTGNPSLADFHLYLGKFLKNSNIRELADTCIKEFSELNNMEYQLQEAFKHVKYYYPQKEIPAIFFHISGFNQSVVIDSGFVSVSIDNYLGEGSSYYQSLLIPMYLRKKMHKSRIPEDVILAYALSEFPFRPIKQCLLSNILYQGKIRYFLKATMPHLSDGQVMGYTSEQLEWCEKNEEMIWQFFVKNKYLFSSDYKIIMKYINDGPFTSGMPKDSPGLVAVWLGMQIVKTYVDENKVSIDSLMKENDYIRILRKSAYQP